MKYILIILSLLTVGCQNNTKQYQQVTEANESLIGTWKTHYRITFLTISIESDNTAVIYWYVNGSHTTQRTKSKPLKNGLIIDTFPRIRLWNIDKPNHIIAKIEEFAPQLSSKELYEFPKTRMLPYFPILFPNT